MTYRLTRNGGEEDENTSQSFYNFDDAYKSLRGVVYGDITTQMLTMRTVLIMTLSTQSKNLTYLRCQLMTCSNSLKSSDSAS